MEYCNFFQISYMEDISIPGCRSYRSVDIFLLYTGVIKDKDGQYWNATKVDEKKRKRKAEALLSDGGKKKKKRAKTKGKMADFCECISNFIQFE